MRLAPDIDMPNLKGVGLFPRAVPVLVLVALVSSLGACDRRTQFQVLTLAVTTAVQEFSAQRAETARALSSAEQARKGVEHEVDLTFSSPKTQRFIDRWKEAEHEVQELRNDFNEVIEKADFLFAYTEKKRDSIRGSAKKKRARQTIAKKKKAFSDAARGTHTAIRELEATVEEGKDLIAMLEIAGALGSLSEEIENLEAVQGRAVDKMPEMEALINEGKGLVDVELAALEAEEATEREP